MTANYPRMTCYLRLCFVVCLFWVLAQQAVMAQERVTVVINGIDGEIKQNVELMLSLNQQKNDRSLTDRRIERLYGRSFDEIKEALKPFGYFRPTVQGTISQANNRWQITYDVTLNDAILITRLDIKLSGEAKEDEQFKKLLGALPLKHNTVLDQRQYDETKQKLQNLAASRGYFNAQFTEHKIVVDMDSYESDVVLRFDSGPRFLYGQIRLNATKPKPELLQRFITFKHGDPYSVDALIDLQAAYNDTDYFESVDIAPQTADIVGDQVPIEINLLPRTKRRYNLGAGYGTDTGVRARVGLDAPLVNEEGHRYDASLLTSQIKDSITTHYRIPGENPRTDEKVVTASYTDEETKTASSEAYMVGYSSAYARGAWRETWSVAYQEERFSVADDKGQTTLLMPGISWHRIWGGSKLYTRKGESLSLDLRVASTYLLSDVDFRQAKAHFKFIRGVGVYGRFISRISAGAIFANEFAEIPSSVRFFAGGDNSVRGYKFNTLGPEDDKGEVTGGRRLTVASAEYEHNLFGNWDGAVFYDIGNAIDSLSEPLMRGAGVGIRWRSPVGPMRFDYAQALSLPGRPWEYHINLGPDL